MNSLITNMWLVESMLREAKRAKTLTIAYYKKVQEDSDIPQETIEASLPLIHTLSDTCCTQEDTCNALLEIIHGMLPDGIVNTEAPHSEMPKKKPIPEDITEITEEILY